MKKIFLLILFFSTCSSYYPTLQAKVNGTENIYHQYFGVQEFITRCPDRAKRLKASLNLNLKELNAVKAGYAKSDAEGMKALIQYYQTSAAGEVERKKTTINAALKAGLSQNLSKYSERVSVTFDSNAYLAERYAKAVKAVENWHKTYNPTSKAEIESGLFYLLDNKPQVYYAGRVAQLNNVYWTSLNVAIRMDAFVKIFYSYIQHPLKEDGIALLLLSYIEEQAEFINVHGATGEGNWTTGESTIFLNLAVNFPEFKNAADWKKVSSGRFLHNLTTDFYADGAQTELSLHYGYLTYRTCMNFRDLMIRAGLKVPATFSSQLNAQLTYNAWCAYPDGALFPAGDSNSENNDLASGLDYAEKTGNDEALYLFSKGQKGKAPNGLPSRLFDWSGYAVSRDTLPVANQFSFFDMGPYGSGHQQHDALMLSIYNKRKILVDNGRYHYFLYDGWTEYYFKATRGHNTVSIDSCTQLFPDWRVDNEAMKKYYYSHSTKPIATTEYKITKDFDFFRGITRNGYIENDKDGKGFGARLLGKNAHRRGVYYKRGKYWVVLDQVFTDQKRDVTTYWHFHPDVKKVEILANQALVTSDADKGNLYMLPIRGNVSPTGKLFFGNEALMQGWYAPTYGQIVPAFAAEYYCKGESLTWYVWLIVPFDGEKLPTLSGVATAQGDGKYSIQLKINEQPDMITIDMGAKPQFEEDKYNEGIVPAYIITPNP
jgi:hypothetical protein